VSAAIEVDPVVVSVEVSLNPDQAFALFTNGLGEWWPKARHSIGKEEVAEIAVDPRLGGRIVERWHDGTEFPWAKFTAWDPPTRFTMEWRPIAEPGPTTEVEVTFSATDTGTLVELTHRGWERLGEDALETRASYDSGWPWVLDLYAGAAA
jgi:uncharacterized protein YndB with AHSA1/START domain